MLDIHEEKMRFSANMLYSHFNYKGQSYKTDLNEQEKVNRDKCVPCIALKRCNYSSFKYVFISGDDQALVNATEYDHSLFSNLLHELKSTYDAYFSDPETGLIHNKWFTPIVSQRI